MALCSWIRFEYELAAKHGSHYCWLYLIDYRRILRKVSNVKFDFDVRFSTLRHRGNVEMDKLGSFVREKTYTIRTKTNLAYLSSENLYVNTYIHVKFDFRYFGTMVGVVLI